MSERVADKVVFVRGTAVLVWFCQDRKDEQASLEYLSQFCSKGSFARWDRLLSKSGAMTVTRTGTRYRPNRGSKRWHRCAVIFFRRRYFCEEAVAHEVCHAYRFLFRRKLVWDSLLSPRLDEHMAAVVGGLTGIICQLGRKAYGRGK